jgi:hypothetical protein
MESTNDNGNDNDNEDGNNTYPIAEWIILPIFIKSERCLCSALCSSLATAEFDTSNDQYSCILPTTDKQ